MVARLTLRGVRLWRPLEEPLQLDGDGFYAPSEARPVSAKALEAIDAPCVVLLGEAGAGKSYALGAERQRLRECGHEPRWIDLGARQDEQSLRSDLRELLRRDGNGALHLLLDGLDERAPQHARVDAILAEELDAVYRSLSRVRLRIACRTGALPARLLESLERVWGQGAVHLYEIVPLSRADVRQALVDAAVHDADRVLARWCAEGVGPLAARPITLGLLLGVEGMTGAATQPIGATKLYERAFDWMLRDVDRGSHRAALRWLAAATLLGERGQIALPGHRSTSADDDAWTLDALAQGREPIDDRMVPVERPLLEAVLQHGALFGAPSAGGDGASMAWRHRSFAEFLCAEWLLAHREGEDAFAPLVARVGETRCVSPHLEGVAVWMAGMRPSLLPALARLCPHRLPDVDARCLDETERASVVAAFFEATDAGRASAWWRLRGVHVARFAHPGLDAQLRDCLGDRSRSVAARNLALWTAEEGRREALLPSVFAVALDTHDKTDVRKEAVHAIAAMLPAHDARLRGLLPLLDEAHGGDDGEDIRGLVLRACWPWCFADAAAAFGALTPPRDERTYGVYALFLDDDALVDYAKTALTDALAWVLRVGRHLGYRGERLVGALVALGWTRIDEPAVLDAMVALRVEALRRYEDLTPPASLREPESARVRLALAEQTLRQATAFPVASFVEAKVSAWLLSVDFDALVACAVALASGDDALADRYLEVALRLHEDAGRPAAQTTRLWEVSEGVPRFVKRLAALWKAADLDEPFVQMLRQPAEPPRPAIPRQDRPSEMQVRQVLANLAQVEAGHVERWWQAHAWMCARPVDEERCRLTQDFRIDETAFWKAADAQTRERVLGAALRYVASCAPDTDEWFGRRLWHKPALAGRAAFAILLQAAPERLAALPPSRWALWVPTFVDPGWMSDDQRGGLWNFMLRVACVHAPDELRTRVMALVDIENERGEYAFVLDALGDVHDVELASRLLSRLHSGPLKPEILRSALALVGRVLPDAAERFCRDYVDAHWHDTGDIERCAVFAGAWLLRTRPDAAWPMLAARFRERPVVGVEVVGRVVDWHTAPPMREPEHIANYYRWARGYLDTLTPTELDMLDEGGELTGGHMVHGSIASTIIKLRELGTVEAVEVLHALREEEPESEFIRGEWYAATLLAAERVWRPWSLDRLRAPGISSALRRRARTMLARYYGDPSLARIIAHDAELPLERVTWRGTPEVLWEEVLEVASACGRLDALLERVAQDYPEARQLHDEFRREQAS